MRLYADHPDRRCRQVLGDVLGLVVVIGAIPPGRGLYGWLSSYAEPGRELEEAAGGLADNLRGAADTIGGVPLVGDPVAEPLTNAADSATAMAEAARAFHADPDGLDVLALRALASAPVAQLAVTGDGLLAAWREGDPEVIRNLAQVELARLGLYIRTPPDVR